MIGPLLRQESSNNIKILESSAVQIAVARLSHEVYKMKWKFRSQFFWSKAKLI